MTRFQRRIAKTESSRRRQDHDALDPRCDVQRNTTGRAGATVEGFAAGLGATEVQLSKLDQALLQFRQAVARRQEDHEVHAVAAEGASGSGVSLPYLTAIQRSFGRHDVSGVAAHTGDKANAATEAMGAAAYASGNDVVLGHRGNDLHTVAHEAAHVVQQRGGVSLKGGVGRADDIYERHADAVADKVVAGENAEGLLDEYAGGTAARAGVQRSAAGVEESVGSRQGPMEKGTAEPEGGGRLVVRGADGEVIGLGPPRSAEPRREWGRIIPSYEAALMNSRAERYEERGACLQAKQRELMRWDVYLFHAANGGNPPQALAEAKQAWESARAQSVRLEEEFEQKYGVQAFFPDAQDVSARHSEGDGGDETQAPEFTAQDFNDALARRVTPFPVRSAEEEAEAAEALNRLRRSPQQDPTSAADDQVYYPGGAPEFALPVSWYDEQIRLNQAMNQSWLLTKDSAMGGTKAKPDSTYFAMAFGAAGYSSDESRRIYSGLAAEDRPAKQIQNDYAREVQRLRTERAKVLGESNKPAKKRTPAKRNASGPGGGSSSRGLHK